MNCVDIRNHQIGKQLTLPSGIGQIDVNAIDLLQQLMNGKKLKHEVYFGVLHVLNENRYVVVDVYHGNNLDEQMTKSITYQETVATQSFAGNVLGYAYLDDDRALIVSDAPIGINFDEYTNELLSGGNYAAFFDVLETVITTIIIMTWATRIKHGRISDLRTIYYDDGHASFINFISASSLPPRTSENPPILRDANGSFSLAEWALSNLPDLMYAINAKFDGDNTDKVKAAISNFFEKEGWDEVVHDVVSKIGKVSVEAISKAVVNMLRNALGMSEIIEFVKVDEPKTPKGKSPQPKTLRAPQKPRESEPELPPKIVPIETINDINTILERTWQKALSIKKPAKDYQKTAVKHMMYNNGLIVGFQVGTGKTLTATMTIFALERLYKMEGRGELKVIILTPASLKENMQDQMIQFGMAVSKTKPKVPKGTPPPKLFERTRYEFMTFAKFQREYKKGAINCKDVLLVVDEAHNLRKDYRNIMNPEFKTNIIIKNTIAEFGIQCSAKAWKTVLLTATPVYNKPYDIVNLVAMAKHQYPPMDDSEWEYINAEYGQNDLNKTFRCLVIFQESNKTDFPARINSYESIEMTDEYYNKYHALELNIWKGMKQPKKQAEGAEGNDAFEKINNAFNVELKKATNDLEPYLKIEQIKKILATREKTVIFSALVGSGINTVKNYMNNTKGLSDKYVEISGKVKISERNEMVKRFNSGKAFVFLITKAGGEGLDLKGVRHVVILEQGWNDATNEQAIGRGIRYKSHDHLPIEERNTIVHYLVMQKPEKIRKALEELYAKKPRKSSKEESPYSADEYFLKITETKRLENNILMRKIEANDIKNGCVNTPV